jgi:hypothetical protein
MIKTGKMIREEKAAFRDTLKRNIKSYIDSMRNNGKLESTMLANCMLRYRNEFHELSKTQNMFEYTLVVSYMMYWITLDEKHLEVEN